jgi:beta-aspartyl-peptidase (threonine type)
MLMPFDPHAGNVASPQVEIQDLLERQAAAWNRGDIDAFMAGYWQSPELSLSFGRDSYRGWQTTLDRYRRLYQQDSRQMGRLTLSDLEIDLLGPECAFVRGHWEMVTNREHMSGRFTLILRKLSEGWRIVHDHTSA